MNISGTKKAFLVNRIFHNFCKNSLLVNYIKIKDTSFTIKLYSAEIIFNRKRAKTEEIYVKVNLTLSSIKEKLCEISGAKKVNSLYLSQYFSLRNI